VSTSDTKKSRPFLSLITSSLPILKLQIRASRRARTGFKLGVCIDLCHVFQNLLNKETVSRLIFKKNPFLVFKRLLKAFRPSESLDIPAFQNLKQYKRQVISVQTPSFLKFKQYKRQV
jgi:hypothetical protein